MSALHPRLHSRDLALVVAIAHHRSLRRAAAAGGQTVAALSKQLRLLEDRLGIPLFQRSSTGVEPTPAGQSLAESGRRILADIEAALAAIRPMPGASLPMVIGAGPFIAPFLARDLAPRIRARWPAVPLEVQVGYPEDLLAGVRDGRMDLAICHLDDVILPPGLSSRLVQRVHPVCVVSARHPLLAQAGAAGGPLPGRALAGLSLAGSRMPARTRAWLRELTGEPSAIGFVSPDYELVAEVVAGSDMFTVMPRLLAQWMCAHHALAVLPVTMPPFVHSVHAIEATGSALPEAGRAIRALLLETLARDETAEAGLAST